jgi:hypothetical protein
MHPQPPKPEDFLGATFGLDRAVAPEITAYSHNDYDRLPKHPTDWDLYGSVGVARDAGYPRRYRCPYGQVGDRLYVREALRKSTVHGPKGPLIEYAADGVVLDDPWRWRLKSLGARYCPREYSRFTLEIVEIRVERLHAISEEDAIGEGFAKITKDGGITCKYGIPDRDGYPGTDDLGWPWEWWNVDPRKSYARLWELINGPGSWAPNPWVWVVKFQRIREAM